MEISEFDEEAVYTQRYVEALTYAAVMHRAQTRKGSRLPYLTHLTAVSALVWQYGGDEDQAIAGLLHDTVEDCGGPPVLADVRERFGPRVAGIVDAATDSATEDPAAKPPWRERKTKHLAKLAGIEPDTALVIACDKLHNLSQTAAEYAREGESVFAKFNPDADTRWYFRRMRETLAPKLPAELVAEIDRNLAVLGA